MRVLLQAAIRISADYTDYADFAFGVSHVYVLKKSGAADHIRSRSFCAGAIVQCFGQVRESFGAGTIFDRIRSPRKKSA
jgi:hypothetical protein